MVCMTSKHGQQAIYIMFDHRQDSISIDVLFITPVPMSSYNGQWDFLTGRGKYICVLYDSTDGTSLVFFLSITSTGIMTLCRHLNVLTNFIVKLLHSGNQIGYIKGHVCKTCHLVLSNRNF